MEKVVNVFGKSFESLISASEIKCVVLEEPRIECKAEEEMKKWVPEESGLKCSYCKIEFKDVKTQREHYKLNWHKYNLKMSLLKKSSVSEAEFNSLNEEVEALEITSSEDEKTLNTFVTNQGKLLLFNEKEYFSIWRCLVYNKKDDFSPQNIKESLTFPCIDNKKWTILMLSGGHFAGAVFNENEVLMHKTFHCYTVRQGQGGSQSSRDGKSATSHPKSAGASLRRYNEQALIQHVRGILEQWTSAIESSSLIFIRAPGSYNRSVLFGGNPPILKKTDPRIRSIPFSTTRPKFTELQRVHEKIQKVQIYENLKDVHSLLEKEVERLKSLKSIKKNLINRAKSRESVNRSLPCSEPSESETEQSDDNLEISEQELSFENLVEFECTEVPTILPKIEKKKNRKRVRNKKDENFERKKEYINIAFTGNVLKFKEILHEFQEFDSKVNFINQVLDEEGNSFLHIAALNEHIEFVEYLLENHADPCLKNKKLQTPFVCTLSKEIKEVMKQFAKKYPDKYNYNKAQIPIPSLSTDEQLERKKVLNRIKREKEREKKKENQKKNTEEKEKRKFSSLTDKEKVALFGIESSDFENTSRCFYCGVNVRGKTPFGYLLFKFCSVECLKNHRLRNI